MSDGEFSVWQWFANGHCEKVRDRVGAKEAVEAAHHYSHSVGATMGTTTRVIIVDGDDYCNFEWIYGKGVTFK
jgi:hypothetical protein